MPEEKPQPPRPVAALPTEEITPPPPVEAPASQQASMSCREQWAARDITSFAKIEHLTNVVLHILLFNDEYTKPELVRAASSPILSRKHPSSEWYHIQIAMPRGWPVGYCNYVMMKSLEMVGLTKDDFVHRNENVIEQGGQPLIVSHMFVKKDAFEMAIDSIFRQYEELFHACVNESTTRTGWNLEEKERQAAKNPIRESSGRG